MQHLTNISLRHIYQAVCRILLCACLALITSCIDEDMSDCGKNYAINYHVQLRTNLHTHLDTELSAIEEQPIKNEIKKELSSVFSDMASDLELSFYTDGAISHYEEHIVNTNSTSYTIYLPVHDYMHHAVANLKKEPNLYKTGSDTELGHTIHNIAGSEIDNHTTAVFTARMPIKLVDEDQEFFVNLYMINCAAIFVLDLNGYSPADAFGVTEGFADSFSIADSTYHYGQSQRVRAKMITDRDKYQAFYTINMPSRDTASSRGADGIWQTKIYIKMDSSVDSYTQNIISVASPLRAGDIRVIKGKLNANGEITTSNPDVGVSVALDWKPGGNWDVDM